jgi:hypothetical protein
MAPEPMSTQTVGGEHVEQVVGRVHKELETLLKQRAEIIKRIGTIKQTILGLANLFGDEAVGEELLDLVDHRPTARQPGFTKTCRMILMEADRPLLTHEVCQEIRRRNPALLARQKDPLASVSTVLNRLASYGEARFIPNERGRRAWQWVIEDCAVATDTISANREPGSRQA